MNPPTLYKKVKITEITPEICRACQILSKNLPDQDKGFDKYAPKQTPTPEQTLTVTESPEELQKRNTDPTHTRNGMIWCPEGLWVFPSKCDTCKVKTYAAWYECQKQKLRQKGEQQRTASNP
jgi:hypothetical protein